LCDFMFILSHLLQLDPVSIMDSQTTMQTEIHHFVNAPIPELAI